MNNVNKEASVGLALIGSLVVIVIVSALIAFVPHAHASGICADGTDTTGSVGGDAIFGYSVQPDPRDAQPFTVATDCTLTGASMRIRWVDNVPDGSVQYWIYNDVAGHPGTAIAQSDDVPSINSTLTFRPASFSGSPVTLSSGSTYYIVPTRIGGTNHYYLADGATITYVNWGGWQISTDMGSTWGDPGETTGLLFEIDGDSVTPPPPPAPPTGFAALVATGNTDFASTTGFTLASAVGFVDENLIKLFIGATLDVAFQLRWWLAALLIIGGIVYFSRRAIWANRL